MEGNGHDKEFRPRSVSIRKEGDIDPESLQSVIESMGRLLQDISSDVKKTKADVIQMRSEMAPAILFHKNMQRGIAIGMLFFFPFVGTSGRTWIKHTLFT